MPHPPIFLDAAVSMHVIIFRASRRLKNFKINKKKGNHLFRLILITLGISVSLEHLAFLIHELTGEFGF